MASRKSKAGSHKRGRSTGRPRSAARKSKGGGKTFKIKRPGALTRAKKRGESTTGAARRLKKTGTPLQKRQASFYLNVLRPANRKRGKKRR